MFFGLSFIKHKYLDLHKEALNENDTKFLA